MKINIFTISNDIFMFVIPFYLSYYDYLNLLSSHRIFRNFELYYYNKKCDIIKNVI